MGIEQALLRLEKEIAFTSWCLRDQRMSSREMAIYHNGLAMKARSAEYQHRAEAERKRHERVMRGG